MLERRDETPIRFPAWPDITGRLQIVSIGVPEAPVTAFLAQSSRVDHLGTPRSTNSQTGPARELR